MCTFKLYEYKLAYINSHYSKMKVLHKVKHMKEYPAVSPFSERSSQLSPQTSSPNPSRAGTEGNDFVLEQ